MQNEFIKVIGRRPVYSVQKGWNELSETHRREAGRHEQECQSDRNEGSNDKAIPQTSRADRD
ncbi:hypothetical protein [Methylocaldum sp.]|uniref:hypothetical protein n=1 Tax=Methylocaldum sp. TaxID=1969727 RepID=UPI002D5B3583|nr:hypothetical protein [Methylocaldum sp.]HYE37960.1 hypothetical protein [Methylocaldum sp.]